MYFQARLEVAIIETGNTSLTPIWVCIRLPSLPLDVFARALAPEDAARPFVVGSGGHYPKVVAASETARTAGIRHDQLISSALALAPEMTLRDRDPVAEASALRDVATCVLAFTPMTSLAFPDAILAEIGGSVRLFGGLPRLLDAMTRRIHALGYTMQVALAPTPTAALLFARGRPVSSQGRPKGEHRSAKHEGRPISPQGRPKGGQRSAKHEDCLVSDPVPVSDWRALPDALAPLPLGLLDIDTDTLATLRAAGVRTFGEAQALPREGVARRFGPQVVDMLDRALGRLPDPREPFVPPPHFERKLPLPAPIEDAEALGFGVHRLVSDLAAWLLARGLGVTRLSLALHHERYLRQRGMPHTTVTFALGAPARAPAHLHSVLRERLARVALPAPVESIVLTSDETAPLASRNLGLLPEDAAIEAIVPLVERLRSRLGDEAVAALAQRAEHRPEYAARETLPTTSPTSLRQSAGRTPRSRTVRVETVHASAPRPLWLLDEAQPLGAMLEDRPWILRDGPERIESGWWDGHDFRRDYFVAESPDGAITWIYRDHRYGTDDGEWFMHGLFA